MIFGTQGVIRFRANGFSNRAYFNESYKVYSDDFYESGDISEAKFKNWSMEQLADNVTKIMEILDHMKNKVGARFRKGLQDHALHVTLVYLSMQQFEIQRRYFESEIKSEDNKFLKDIFFVKYKFHSYDSNNDWFH